MTWKKTYQNWMESTSVPDELKFELNGLAEEELKDRFFKQLSFGTGGMRGIIGAGTNRMNRCTVRRVSHGLGDYLKNTGYQAGSSGVSIAYDCRLMSQEFAEEAALTLCANGFRVYLFESLRATPELSFCVRKLGCKAGVVVTASHNTKEYNGYKIYGADGSQITDAVVSEITRFINRIDSWETAKSMPRIDALAAGLLQIVGKEIDYEYIEAVKSLATIRNNSNLRIIYTPLHGTGLVPVSRCFEELGYEDFHVVKAQAIADGSFPTVVSPNPEEPEALNMAIELARSLSADIVLATDPDCDRVGVAVRTAEGDYFHLSGNQVGALLVNYLMTSGKRVPENAVIIKTIVTSDLGAVIAAKHGARVIETLTGFKYIGEEIGRLESSGNDSFLFGYEESNGYLTGTFVRDKDAVIASVLIVEMCSYYKSRGATLFDVINHLQKEHGYYSESLQAYTVKGMVGLRTIQNMMSLFRANSCIMEVFPRMKRIEDYLNGTRKIISNNTMEYIGLPSSDVMKFIFEDGSWFAVRPSGTEPKIKFYFSAKGVERNESIKKLSLMKTQVENLIATLKGQNVDIMHDS